MTTLSARHLDTVITRLGVLLPAASFVGSPSQLAAALDRLVDLPVLHDHTGRSDATYRQLLGVCAVEPGTSAGLDPAIAVLVDGLSAPSTSAAAPRPVLSRVALIVDVDALLRTPVLKFYVASADPAVLVRRLSTALPHAEVKSIATMPVGGAVAIECSFTAARIALAVEDAQNWELPGTITLKDTLAADASAPVLDLIGLSQAYWSQDPGKATIAVLDTGIDQSHLALRRVAAYRNFTRFADADEDGHGTHVASIAAGDSAFCDHAFRGVAPNCRLVSGKVLHRGDQHEIDWLEQVLNGMAWAVFDEQADVLSISLYDDDMPPSGRSIWTRACDEAFHHGTIVCVAAGNLMDPGPFPELGTINVPGDAVTAVTVGAIDTNRRLAGISARGVGEHNEPLAGKPNCVAPGVGILAARSTARPDGAGHLIAETGTSMATPVVAGCLALIKSRARAAGVEMPPADVIRIFYESCETLTDEAGETYLSHEIGHGLVNMATAFAKTDDYITSAPAQPAVGARPKRTEMLSFVPPTSATWAPNTCYGSCATTYQTTVGVFSDTACCEICRTPICAVCWALGDRRCRTHAGPAATAIPMVSTTPRVASPSQTTQFPAPVVSATFRGASPMTIEPVNPCVIRDAADLAGQRFATSFEQRAVRIPEMVNPVTAHAVKHEKGARQETKYRFGDMLRYNFTGGLRLSKLDLRHSQLSLIALRLCREGIEHRDGQCVPSPGLIRHLPDAFHFDDKGYYVVGIFSPFGWPEMWTRQEHGGANFEVHLVEETGRTWRISGPRTDFSDLFNPESDDSKAVRVLAALKGSPELAVPGGQVALDVFATAHGFRAAFVTAVISGTDAGYKTVTHRSQTLILRSFR